MSSISSAGTGLFQYLQQLNNGSSTSAAPATPSNVAASVSATPTDPTTTGTATGATPPKAHHHHGGHGGGQFSKLSQAVTSALQSAQSDGSNADPNQIIEDAISKVLKGAGVGQGSTTSSTDGSTSSTAAGATSATGQTDTDGGSSKQAFLQNLQQFGISPQQFHADFLVAVKDAQGGQVDPGAAFKSFPPGSMVDTMG